ncbi:sensor histidine kinase [Streptomyces coeruleoprunus]|uniref:histidine kinase n=1 Tax=Streptomyces coeruleoprunus TaxID=285563 RepID=A0ABV9XEC0_9ACTN
MDVKAMTRAGWRWLAPPELWTRRRTALEAVVAVVMGLLAAGIEELLGSGDWYPAVVGVAAAALSLLRRRLPVAVLAVTGALTPVVGGFLLLLILVGWSAGRLIAGPGRTLVAFTVSYALFVGASLLDGMARQAPMTMVLLTTLYYLATTVMPGLASRYWIQRRTLLHALQDRNAQLLRERAMVEGQARLRERQRIAQDMHDSLGHQLALISVHTGALEVDRALTDRQREAVGVLREASVNAMRELREVVGILRDGIEAPAAPDDGSGQARRGTAGIDALVDAARAAGNDVELERSGEPRPLAPAADHAAYRIVQEALTNAYKHAPGAAIAVELRYEPDSLVVEVVNAAGGAAPEDVVSGGQGLTGLHERARLVGGMVHAGPVDGAGFRVAAVLPYGVPGAVAPPLVDAVDDFGQQARALRAAEGAGSAAPAGAPGSVPGGVPQGGVPGGAFPGAYQGGYPGPYPGSWPDVAPPVRGTSGVAVGCGIAAAVGLVLLVVAGFGMFFLVGAMSEGMITRTQYEKIKIGADEQEVRDRLPKGETIATFGLDGLGPEEPAGADCLVLLSTAESEDFDSEPVFRFCFKDGKLIEKKAYEVKR